MFSLKKMMESRAQAVVDAPPDKVFSYVTDFHRHHEWLPADGGTQTQKISEGPVAVGSTFRRVNRRRFLPYQLDVVATQYAPNERLAFEEGPLDGWHSCVSTHLEPEPVSGGTRVTVRRGPGHCPWWGWPLMVLCLPVMPVFRHFFRRKIRGLGPRLKEYYQRPAP